jgi:hypothetical protein
VVCPSVAAEFEKCTVRTAKSTKSTKNPIMKNPIKDADLEKAGKAYSAVVQCLELFEQESRKAMGVVEPK